MNGIGDISREAICLTDDAASCGEGDSAAPVGEIDSFQPVFDRCYRPILSFIYHYLGDRALAEELAQETLMRTYFRLHAKNAETKLETFVFGIARNVMREELKKKYRPDKPTSLETEKEDPRDMRPTPDRALLVGELMGAIREAVARLSEDCRVVFVLKVFHQLRYREIAAITGSSIGKLKTDLHRARVLLRQDLEPLMSAGDTEVQE